MITIGVIIKGAAKALAQKHKEETGKDIVIPEKVLRAVSDVFFYEVQRDLIQMNTPGIYIPHIGTFFGSKKKIYKEIGVTIRKIRKLRSGTSKMKPESAAIRAEDLVKYLRKLLIHRNRIAKNGFYQSNAGASGFDQQGGEESTSGH